MRRFVAAVAVAAIASGSLMAAEVRGTLRKIEQSKNRIVVTVNNEDRVQGEAAGRPVPACLGPGTVPVSRRIWVSRSREVPRCRSGRSQSWGQSLRKSPGARP